MSRRAFLVLVAVFALTAFGCSHTTARSADSSGRKFAPAILRPDEAGAPKTLPPLPNLPATGVARIDEDGVLITPKGRQRRPPADKKFADVMDNVVLVAPAVFDGTFDSNCDLQDAETGAVVGNVTTSDVSAGGTIVECTKLAAHAKAVILFNSRGTYAKEVSSGRLLPCGDGAVFADDFKTCLRLDTSPMVYAGGDDPHHPNRDFPIEICAIEYELCRPLFTVHRGLNRAPGTRTWDGTYCADDRVAIVADGKLHLFNARSRRELSVEPAPQKTKVTCVNGKPVTR